MIAAPLHLEQHVLDIGHPQLEVALHVALIQAELTFDLRERGDVLFEQRLTVTQRGALTVSHRHRDAERVQQLELRAARRVQCGRHVTLESLETAGRPDRRLAALGAERQLRADEEDLGLEAEEGLGVVSDERSNLADLRRAFEDVALVHDNDDFLAPASNVLHEAALRLGERTIG